MKLALQVKKQVHVTDLIQLTKPGIVLMSGFTTLGGFLLYPGQSRFELGFWIMIGTALAVASANSLNMFMEREADRQMRRTAQRPLPAGRLEPRTAVVWGVQLFVASQVILFFGVSPLVAITGLLAWGLYIFAYTPLKYRTPLAMFVGALSGAAPPLMGWVAASGSLDPQAWTLFLVLFLWQVPHTIAISLKNSEDYRRAGVAAAPLVWGRTVSLLHALAYATAIVPVSLLLSSGAAGQIYQVTALVAGTGFWLAHLIVFFRLRAPVWPRVLFAASLIYLLALCLGLTLDRLQPLL